MSLETAQLAHWPQTPAEFENLVESTQDQLVHFAFHRLGNREEAEDVVQEVFVQAFRDRAKRKHIAGVLPYLFRMVANRCTEIYRARSRQADQEIEEFASLVDTHTSLAEAERAALVRRLLDRIPPQEAEVIRLRAYSELSFADVAEIAGSSVPTVKSRFRYGVERLRRLLGPKEETR